jgi:hypothetical protein
MSETSVCHGYAPSFLVSDFLWATTKLATAKVTTANVSEGIPASITRPADTKTDVACQPVLDKTIIAPAPLRAANAAKIRKSKTIFDPPSVAITADLNNAPPYPQPRVPRRGSTCCA